ncbi:hypothetical protein K461DRAFT_316302 [Myriangium duriaei CBS 260.36]|uniref:2EXR domain-containing protein n=1 Tax=Myriangium duriaei CBS 260.36 TaxID=1168546 RepID=A0A9P4IR31_9PEZI|nr:hypothetical protein K461DRAFT_316302 [Myriangium duriaei CBS 260.36]
MSKKNRKGTKKGGAGRSQPNTSSASQAASEANAAVSTLTASASNSAPPMATSTLPMSTFPQFSRLPKEIRDKIWQSTFPNGPSLYRYNALAEPFGPKLVELMMLRRIGAGNMAASIHRALGMGFDSLEVKSRLPAALAVNHEARAIVLAWATQMGWSMHRLTAKEVDLHRSDLEPKLRRHYLTPDEVEKHNRLTTVYNRKFVPDFDFILLESEWWDTFMRGIELSSPCPSDLWDFLCQPDRVVVHEESLDKKEFLGWLFKRGPTTLTNLHVLIDPVRELNGSREIRPMRGVRWVWNDNRKRFNNMGDGPDLRRGCAAHKRLNKKLPALGDILVRLGIEQFEVKAMSIMPEPIDRIQLRVIRIV